MLVEQYLGTVQKLQPNVQGDLGCEQTERQRQQQRKAARSHWNAFAAPLATPNRSQTYCLNLPLTLPLPLAARSVHSLINFQAK